MKRINVFIFTLCILWICPITLTAQTASEPIEGTYRLVGTDTGLQIKKLTDGNYLFQKIILESNGTYSPFEWQSDYVCASQNSIYIFSWHTGRYLDIPGTNKLIVYRLIYNDGRLTGTYYFPENLQSPPGNVVYVKY